MRSSSIMTSHDIFLEWCSCDSATLVHMRRQHLDKQRYGLLYLFIGDMNECFCCYIVITNGEKSYERRNSSVTGRPCHRRYFHCSCTTPSGGEASRVHGLTTRRACVWYTLFISYHFLFIRLFLFLLCVYCYSILLTIISFMSHPFSIIVLFFSLKSVLLYTISLFIFRVRSVF